MRLAAAVLCFLSVAASAACSDSSDPTRPRPVAEGDALELRVAGETGFVSRSPVGSHSMISLELVVARRTIELVSVEPVDVSGSPKPVATLANLVQSPSRPAWNSHPFGVCTTEPLPAVYKRLEPLEGFRIEEGEKAALNLVVRRESEKEGQVQGVTITYKVEGEIFQQRSESVYLQFLPPAERACGDDGWFSPR